VTTDEGESHDAETIGGLVSDTPASQDAIGFDSYTNALAAFLLAEETEPPLTVSVEGSWGTGKSSFMRQLRKRLEANDAVTIEFNAWRHESSEDLWAGFVKSFIPQVVASRERRLGRLRSALRLYRLRLWKEITQSSLSVRLLILGLIVTGSIAIFTSDATQTSLLSPFNLSDSTVKLLVGNGSVFVALAAIVTLVGAVINRVWSPLRNGVATAITGPEQGVSESFRAAALDDFDQLTDAYLGDKTAYVFVDDLDRMGVPKAAELLREINLYLGESSQIIFIFGMDREKVAAGLAASNEPVLPFLTESRRANTSSQNQQESNDARGLEFGLQYLEKFVQVPVRVPKPDPHSLSPLFERTVESDQDSSMDEFDNLVAPDSLRSLDSKAEGWQKLIYHVSNLLENNPRKIKSFGNLYRLHGYLAAQEELFDASPPVTAPQLAKYVALAIQYPQLATLLREYPDLIRQFEEYEPSDEVDTLCEPWIHYESVQALFQLDGDDEIGSSTLTEQTLIQLSRVAPTLESDPDTSGADTKRSQGTASQGMGHTLADIDIGTISPVQERLYHDLQSPHKLGHEFSISRGARPTPTATENRDPTPATGNEDLCALLTAKNIRPYNVQTDNSQIIDLTEDNPTPENASLFDGPMVVVRSKFSVSDGIVAGYIWERLLISRDILVVQEPDDQPEKLYAIVGLLRSKLLLFYYLIDETMAERGASTLSLKVLEDFPLPEEFASKQLTEPVKRMQEIQTTEYQTPPNLMDYLGGYDLDEKLGDIGELPDDPSPILTATTKEYSNLRIASVSIERTGNILQVLVTVRYRPEEQEGTETDQWGYTESKPLTAIVCSDLDSNLADLIEAFVPVATEEAGGFAGFRSTATETVSPADRLQEITLPALPDVVAGLDDYQEALYEYEQLEQEKRDIQNDIDQAVYELYGLSEEQINVLESGFVQDIYDWSSDR